MFYKHYIRNILASQIPAWGPVLTGSDSECDGLQGPLGTVSVGSRWQWV